MKIKTAELTGAALDWAVAKSEGAGAAFVSTTSRGEILALADDTATSSIGDHFNPSTNWAQGGPIIEREKIDVTTLGDEWEAELEHLTADDSHYAYGGALGPTPLIAAMRCYVASKLGTEVEVPEELL